MVFKKTFLEIIKGFVNLNKSLNTITIKLLMLVLFITIVPLIALAQFSTDLIRNNMTEVAQNQLTLSFKLAQNTYNDKLNLLKMLMSQGIETSLESYFSLSGNKKDISNLYKLLKNITQKADLSFLLLLDKNKNIISSTSSFNFNHKTHSLDSLIDQVLLKSEVLATSEIFSNEEIPLSELRLSNLIKIKELNSDKYFYAGLCQLVAVPILNKDNDVIAIAIAGKFLAKDFKLVNTISNLTGAMVKLIQIKENGYGIVISSNVNTYNGTKTLGESIQLDQSEDFFNQNVQKRVAQNNEYWLKTYYPIQNIDGNVLGLICLEIPENKFTSLAIQNIKLVGIISVIGLFIAIFISAIFARTLTTPILILADSAQKISKGDLSVRVNVKGSTELTQMGNAFNLMTEGLQKEYTLRDDFVATLTHDLKVPLLAENQTINYMIKGAYGDLTLDQKEVLSIIKNTNESTLEMINTLLEVYRFDEGKYTLLKAPQDINETIKLATTTVLALIDDKNITLTFDLADSKIIVDIDEREIKRIIHNLLANAIYSTQSKGEIIIKSELFDYSKVYKPENKEFLLTTLKYPIDLKNSVLISIYDTGIGMDKEDINNLFKRFSSNKGRKPSSTGLGLYYSYQMLSAHNGTIWAESEESKGSVFKFTLPIFKKQNV